MFYETQSAETISEQVKNLRENFKNEFRDDLDLSAVIEMMNRILSERMVEFLRHNLTDISTASMLNFLASVQPDNVPEYQFVPTEHTHLVVGDPTITPTGTPEIGESKVAEKGKKKRMRLKDKPAGE